MRAVGVGIAVLLLASTGCPKGGAVAGPSASCPDESSALTEVERLRDGGHLHRAVAAADELAARCPGGEATKRVATLRQELGPDEATVRAHREATDDARRRAALLYRDGVDRRLAGDLDGALRQLERAQAAVPHPYILIQIGEVHRAAGREVEARIADERALALAEWSERTRAVPRFATRHAGDIWAIRYDPSGRLLATGGADGQVLLWEAATGSLVRRLGQLDDGVSELAFTEDGEELIAVAGRHLVSWAPATGAELRRIELAADSVDDPLRVVLSSPYRGYALVRDSGQLSLRDPAGSELRELRAPSPGALAVSFDRAGERLLLVSRDHLTVWTVADGEVVQTVPREDDLYLDRASFTADGRAVAVAGPSGLTFIDLATGARRTIPGDFDGGDLSFAADGQSLMAVRYAEAWLVDPASGRERARLGGYGSGLLLSRAIFHPAGDLVATGDTEGVIRIYDARTGRKVKQLGGDTWGINDVSFYDRGLGLVLASDDGSVKLWTPRTRSKLLSVWGHRGWVVFARMVEDRLLVSGSKDNTVRLFDISKASKLSSRRADIVGKGNSALAVSRNRGLVAYSTYRGGRRWSVQVVDPRRKRAPVIAPAGGLAEVDSLWIDAGPIRGRPTALAFDASGVILAVGGSGGSGGSAVALYDLERRRVRVGFAAHEARVSAIAIAPSGAMVATASASAREGIKLWDATTGKLIRSLPGHEKDFAVELAFSPDGQRLLSVARDHTVAAWSVESGERIYELTAHEAIVTGIAFHPAGDRFATSSKDRTVRLWNAASGTLMATVMPSRTGAWVAVAADGRVDGSPHAAELISWQVGALRLPGRVGWSRAAERGLLESLLRTD